MYYTPEHTPPDASSVDNSENVYVAQKIIKHRETGTGELEYLVQWKGYKRPSWTRGHYINDSNLCSKYFKSSSLQRSLPSHSNNNKAVHINHPSNNDDINGSNYHESVDEDHKITVDSEDDNVEINNIVNNDDLHENDDMVLDNIKHPPSNTKAPRLGIRHSNRIHNHRQAVNPNPHIKVQSSFPTLSVYQRQFQF